MADVISRLRLESGEFDSKIKRAGQELLAYSAHCRKMGLEMGYANRDAKEFAKQLGSMATVSQTARGKISELSEAFVNAKVMYKNMTDEEKNNTFGKNLAASLDQLKIRIEAAKQDFADVNKELAGGGKFGEFGNVIDTLGSKLGVTGNLTEMMTSKTAMLTGAVGAGIAIVSKATEAWAGYNAELAKQDQITTVTTGLKDDDANRMTDTMRALSDTYNVDFREAINAANTLMTQFGETGDSATKLIKDGMQGMIQGDGPKLLSMIQQYAPAFRDAGVSASQLVAVIQNSEGGIFTDQNMNAIIMGIKNIRLMTKATSDALAQLGIDGQKMSKQLSDGSLTIFDALKQVAAAVQNVNSNSQAAGEVMQQVFGRQGAMAGTKLGEAIATLNTNLEETKRQTGEVGGALAELQTANERLNTAIRDCFEYDGWDQMANGIKTNLVTALASVLEYIGRIKNSLSDFLADKGIKGSGGYSDIEKTQKWINNGKDDNERRSRYNKAMGQLQTKLNNVGKERLVRNSDGSTSYVIDDEQTQAKKRAALQKRMSMLYATSYTPKPEPIINTNFEVSGSGGGGNKTTTAPTYAADSIAAVQSQLSDLNKQFNEVGETERKSLVGPIIELEVKLKQMKEDAQWMKDLASGKYSLQDYHFKEGMQGAMTERGAESLRFAPNFDERMKEAIEIKAPLQLDEKATKALGNQIKQQSKSEKKEEKSAVEVMSQVNSGISGILSGIEGLGIELPQGMREMVSGISSVLTVLQGITILVQGIAALQEVGTFLGIIPGMARGGIVRAAGGTLVGNTYSGDQLRGIDQSGQIYGLNAGEVVLNRAQVGNLASQLEGAGLGNLNLTATISGEQILLASNNRGRRTGRGEIVQSRRVR